jgi:glycerol-3-phosphate cytidylyltransferase
MKKGFTCGAFDLLHAGHIVMLMEAKENCDYLIVGLQTDPSLDRKEKNKPVQSIYERYTQLNAIKYIDEILPYDTEKSLLDLLEATEIDIRFVGDDYADKKFTGHGLHETYYTSRKHSFSTTTLRERIKNVRN